MTDVDDDGDDRLDPEFDDAPSPGEVPPDEVDSPEQTQKAARA